MTYCPPPSCTEMILERFNAELVGQAGLSVAVACVAYLALILLAAAGMYCGWKWWRSPALPYVRLRCRRGMMLVAFLTLACAVFLGLMDLIALTYTFALGTLDSRPELFDRTLVGILGAVVPPVAVSGVACVLAILMGLPAPGSGTASDRSKLEGAS